MADEFNILKPLPTRSGPAQGDSFERKMMEKAGGPNTVAKVIRTHPDGSTTTLKTRAGNPHYHTTEVAKPEEVDRCPHGLYFDGIENIKDEPGWDRLETSGGKIRLDNGQIVKIRQGRPHPVGGDVWQNGRNKIVSGERGRVCQQHANERVWFVAGTEYVCRHNWQGSVLDVRVYTKFSIEPSDTPVASISIDRDVAGVPPSEYVDATRVFTFVIRLADVTQDGRRAIFEVFNYQGETLDTVESANRFRILGAANFRAAIELELQISPEGVITGSTQRCLVAWSPTVVSEQPTPVAEPIDPTYPIMQRQYHVVRRTVATSGTPTQAIVGGIQYATSWSSTFQSFQETDPTLCRVIGVYYDANDNPKVAYTLDKSTTSYTAAFTSATAAVGVTCWSSSLSRERRVSGRMNGDLIGAESVTTYSVNDIGWINHGGGTSYFGQNGGIAPVESVGRFLNFGRLSNKVFMQVGSAALTPYAYAVFPPTWAGGTIDVVVDSIKGTRQQESRTDVLHSAYFGGSISNINDLRYLLSLANPLIYATERPSSGQLAFSINKSVCWV